LSVSNQPFQQPVHFQPKSDIKIRAGFLLLYKANNQAGHIIKKQTTRNGKTADGINIFIKASNRQHND